MEIKIAGHTLRRFKACTIYLKHDSPASTFTLSVYYDPDDALHNIIYRPFSYHRVEIFVKGVKVLTGTLLSPRLSDGPQRDWDDFSGYALPGILEDTCIIDTADEITVDEANQTAAVPEAPLEYSGLTLEDIATRVIRKQGISLVVDEEVRKDPNFAVPFNKVSVKPEQTVTRLLDDLCRRKNIVLSHTPNGELLLTRAKANKLLTNQYSYVKERPVGGEGQAFSEGPAVAATERAILFDFSAGQYLKIGLSANGQSMHRVIQVIKQVSAESTGGGSPDGAAINPYVPADSRGLRFRRVVQTLGDESDVIPTARMLVGNELKNIKLTIRCQGHVLNGHLITPNQMITVMNKRLHLRRKSKWFIQEVVLHKEGEEEVSEITAVLPECFNNEKIINVFQ